ncbi:tellurite resistance TerB family protein [Polaribacter glomeratus]|uniref:Fructose 1,6-bisphosphatase n=1 Tax=Polaribacter glomeratus TaxID=102 RepID=A0A2S7WGT8_9FLAO|nr:TerB family tellurite resistance protein [Polaribacter glomeratus]PQJ76815.1 hypothetical protein BTO16_13150 [Polaribacter glomeratus]TXD67342.1 TerB family tellurite resistance protein [Polaribacter glomeratus]
MSISDLYSSGKHKQEIGHFSNIVKMAKANGKISEEEEALLIKSAKKLHITTEEFKIILENPDKFPINPPVNYEERIERLFFLTKMIVADGEVNELQVVLLRKVAIGLHFPVDTVDKLCNEAIQLVIKDNDLVSFTVAIKKIGSI